MDHFPHKDLKENLDPTPNPSQSSSKGTHIQSSAPQPSNPPMNSPSNFSQLPDDIICSILESPLVTLATSLSDPHSISFHDLIEAYALLSQRLRGLMYKKDPQEAFLPIRNRGSVLVGALRRDISRSLKDSMADFQFDMHPDSGASGSAHFARQSARVSVHALRSLSDLFHFPDIFECIPENDISLLLSDVLTITLTPQLPAWSPKRTNAMARWVLLSQRLPSQHIQPLLGRFGQLLRSSLGNREPDNLQEDGLKIMRRLVALDLLGPSTPASEAIDRALHFILSDCPTVRLAALNLLAELASAKLRGSTSLSQSRQLSLQVRKFVDTQEPLISPSKLVLFAEANISAPVTESPLYAAIAAACLIVLSDRYLLNHQQSYHFINRILQPLRVQKSSHILTSLASHVSNCLVWAYGRLQASPSPRFSDETKTFEFLLQDLKNDISVSVMTVLMNDPRGVDMAKVLTLLETMIKHRRKAVVQRGITLLGRLTDISQSGASEFNLDSILACALFDGSLIGDIDKVADLQLLKNIHMLPPLSESQVVGSHEALLGLWSHAATLYVADPEFPSQIVSTWKHLILDHENAPERYARTLTNLMTSIPPVPLDVIDSLWSKLTASSTPQSLSAVADPFMSALLDHVGKSTTHESHSTWLKLTSEAAVLASGGLELLLHLMRERKVPESLHALVMQQVVQLHPVTSWTTLASFATLILYEHNMELDPDIWEAFLDKLCFIAASASIVKCDLVDHIIGPLDDEKEARLLVVSERTLRLFKVARIQEHSIFPIPLCALAAKLLLSSKHASVTVDWIEYMDSVITSISPAHLVKLLKLWSGSLQHCIKTTQEHNEILDLVYANILKSLTELPPCVEILQLPVLCLPQLLVRNTATLDAFEMFWRATFYGRKEFYDLYPAAIRNVVRSYDYVFGKENGLAADLPDSMQSETSNIVPETPEEADSQDDGMPLVPLEHPVEITTPVRRVIPPYEDPWTYVPLDNSLPDSSPFHSSSYNPNSPSSPTQQRLRRRRDSFEMGSIDPDSDSTPSKRQKLVGSPGNHDFGGLTQQHSSIFRSPTRSPLSRRSFAQNPPYDNPGRSKESQLMTPEPSEGHTPRASRSGSPGEDYDSWEVPVDPSRITPSHTDPKDTSLNIVAEQPRPILPSAESDTIRALRMACSSVGNEALQEEEILTARELMVQLQFALNAKSRQGLVMRA